jgi:pyruvate-formate lyase-activating enzyme
MMSKNIVYVVRKSLYVAVTNTSNTTSLYESRGAGFGMQSFSPLPDGYEPTAIEIESAVADELKIRSFESLVFAGLGEPTLRLSTVLEAAQLLRRKHSKMPLRINTNGWLVIKLELHLVSLL